MQQQFPTGSVTASPLAQHPGPYTHSSEPGRISGMDWTAIVLASAILIAPLAAGMIGAQQASGDTKARSQAPVDTQQDQKK